MSKAIRKVIEVAQHRNGVSGEPFSVVRFTSTEAEGEFIGVVFGERGTCAVLNVPMLAQGNIAFANGNSWREDYFETELREAIAEYESKWRERIYAARERDKQANEKRTNAHKENAA